MKLKCKANALPAPPGVVQTLPEMADEACRRVSEILSDVLSGRQEMYTYRPHPEGPSSVSSTFTRWGLVEKEMHAAIREALGTSQDTQPLDVKPRGREGAGEPAAGKAEQSSLTAATIR